MAHLIAMIDGSLYSQSVCDHAAWLAKRNDCSVEILHVLGRRETSSGADLSGSIGLGARSALLEELAELDGQRARLGQKRGRAILEDAKTRMEKAGVKTVTTRLRHGDLLETLQEAEADADYYVIGKRGEAADFAQMHLGSNVERVARSVSKPLLVTSRAFQPIERFLIAFDAGASVTKAIDTVCTNPELKGLHCVLLHVGPETPHIRSKIEDAAATLRESGGFSVDVIVEDGQAETVIAQKIETENIDLMVMGAYGHSRIRSMIIGSTTTEMIRSCTVPILLYR